MNRMKRFAGGASYLSLLAFAACTGASPSSTYGPAASSAPAQGAPALAALQTRDRIVHLYGASHGARNEGALVVTVHDDEGRLIADGLSLDELRTLDPFLYEACTSAVARGTESPGRYLDARLYIEDVRSTK